MRPSSSAVLGQGEEVSAAAGSSTSSAAAAAAGIAAADTRSAALGSGQSGPAAAQELGSSQGKEQQESAFVIVELTFFACWDTTALETVALLLPRKFGDTDLVGRGDL